MAAHAGAVLAEWIRALFSLCLPMECGFDAWCVVGSSVLFI